MYQPLTDPSWLLFLSFQEISKFPCPSSFVKGKKFNFMRVSGLTGRKTFDYVQPLKHKNEQEKPI